MSTNTPGRVCMPTNTAFPLPPPSLSAWGDTGPSTMSCRYTRGTSTSEPNQSRRPRFSTASPTTREQNNGGTGSGEKKGKIARATITEPQGQNRHRCAARRRTDPAAFAQRVLKGWLAGWLAGRFRVRLGSGQARSGCRGGVGREEQGRVETRTGPGAAWDWNWDWDWDWGWDWGRGRGHEMWTWDGQSSGFLFCCLVSSRPRPRPRPRPRRTRALHAHLT
ncbi:hypothetical protein BS50DRAFT_383011 [Corynespora cassiicola Philippines]|uniref:Uncharacterized protein n=1 Tax=Corynespora cassiicola Philippines TaxID=1448308 RepID=A0A2T2NNV9_CORCC|nr:hypothetical protein BS50DRAFT_383011 [Corynespora cassiicola Philippines]